MERISILIKRKNHIIQIYVKQKMMMKKKWILKYYNTIDYRAIMHTESSLYIIFEIEVK